MEVLLSCTVTQDRKTRCKKEAFQLVTAFLIQEYPFSSMTEFLKRNNSECPPFRCPKLPPKTFQSGKCLLARYGEALLIGKLFITCLEPGTGLLLPEWHEFSAHGMVSITENRITMMSYEPSRPLDRCPSHPGALLSEVIAATDKSKAEIARVLGISRQQLYDILQERKPITPVVAARLGTLFDDGAAIWLRMQATHDAWRTEHDVELSRIR